MRGNDTNLGFGNIVRGIFISFHFFQEETFHAIISVCPDEEM